MAGRKRSSESRDDERISSDDEDNDSVSWEEGIDIDELIEDAREYDDFNTQVDDELAAYTESEMMAVDYEGGSEAAQSSARNVSEVVCVSEHRSRQKRCPGHKRRIVTVTQWDASARRQMIKQLGQRGVT